MGQLGLEASAQRGPMQGQTSSQTCLRWTVDLVVYRPAAPALTL
jgi:hypothetical protein